MVLTPNPASPSERGRERLACDLLIVGAGIGGLSMAHHAAAAGLSVRVLESGSGERGAVCTRIASPARWRGSGWNWARTVASTPTATCSPFWNPAKPARTA
jgi:flavin-dependent dehydrogenase